MSTRLFEATGTFEEESLKLKIPNVYEGTELGRVTCSGSEFVGCRVLYRGCFGTVHFVGRLPNCTGTWIGVDWDDPTRGRHDGTFKDVNYFQASSKTSGSFVKPEHLSRGSTLEETIFYRYVICTECQLSVLNSSRDVEDGKHNYIFRPTDRPGHIDGILGGDNSPRDAEFTGVHTESSQPIYFELFTSAGSTTRDNNADRHANCGPQGVENALRKLRSICLSQIPIYRCLYTSLEPETIPVWPLPGGNLGSLLPRLVELDLSHCLFSKWIDIAEICAQLPTLEILNVSNNRLRSPLTLSADSRSTDDQLRKMRLLNDLDTDTNHADTLFKRAFPKLYKLVAVKIHVLNWSDLGNIVTWMPCLQSLAVAHNNLGNLIPNHLSTHTHLRFRGLVELDLTSTGITDLTGLFAVIGSSTVLNKLLLNQNAISDWPEKDALVGQSMGLSDYDDSQPHSPIWFPGLTTLALKGTDFNDWRIIHRLLHLPKLNNLTMSDCPLLTQMTSESARQELIARLPRLTMLNRIYVDKSERSGAEVDYLKRYGAAWHAAVDAVKQNAETTAMSDFCQKHPTFSQLCDKIGPPEIGETKKFTKALKEGLVNVTFLCTSSSNIPSGLSFPENGYSRDIPIRMSVGHLRMMVQRLFKLPAKTTFEMVIRSERHRKIGAEISLDNVTREVAYYSVEDGDTIYLRLT